MKATGIIRRIDSLGRIVVPSEIRKKLNWNIEDSIEFYVENDKVCLQKYEVGCCKCGDTNTIEFFGKTICKECFREEACKYL